MRFGILLAVVLGFAGAAAADEAHYLPKVGTTVTFRLMTTNDTGGKQVTVGQIYRVTTVAIDGVTAENTLTPLALIYGCPASETSSDCQQARNFPNVTHDGDLITVPLPADVSAALAKIGRLAARDFLRYTQVFPFPGPENLDDTATPKIGATPMWVQTSKTECDDSLDRFFPLGAVAKLNVSCTSTIERSQGRIPALKDAKSAQNVTVALSFNGHDHIAVPAGDFAVSSVGYTVTPTSGPGVIMDGEVAFIENLGFSAKNTLLLHYPNSSNTSHYVRELIKVGS